MSDPKISPIQLNHLTTETAASLHSTVSEALQKAVEDFEENGDTLAYDHFCAKVVGLIDGAIGVVLKAPVAMLTGDIPQKYLRHLDTCNIMQDWLEADQAMVDTPQAFRDAGYYQALEEMEHKKKTCTCGLKELLDCHKTDSHGK